MTGAEFEALVADIKAHGQLEPIMMTDGRILDGRNRYRACRQLGIEPITEEWDRDGTPQAFVVSMNLHRRHLNESQRALVAAKIANIETGSVGRCRPRKDTEISVPMAADLLNVHHTSVTAAKTVLREGTPEEIASIEKGEVAVSTIAKQIRKGASKERRKAMRDLHVSQVGKNPERIQRQQMNAEIWGRVRDALIHLTSLPLPAEVVAIVRASDRTGLTDARLAQAITWLREFDREWRDRNQVAA